jgi:glycosyltransferase involved in cell wall biosynthesis
MKLLMVADQQNSPATYTYLKKLARQLDKAGLKVKSHTEKLEDIEQSIGGKPPALVHVHYHPASKKIRHVMRVCEARGILVVVTFHEVVRVPPERVEHVRKCIERARYAYFLSEADRQHALSLNPRLADASEVVRIPAPSDLGEEHTALRERLLEGFAKEGAEIGPVLLVSAIEPERGIEQVIDLAASLPEGASLRVAGTVPPGQGDYARYLQAKAKFGHSRVSVEISKRRLGKKQLGDALKDALFAYLPCGRPGQEGYSGITEHSMLVPFLNVAQVLVFAHAGAYTSPTMKHVTHILKKPEDLPKALQHYREHPELLHDKLMNAAHVASSFTWADLARQSVASYKSILQP